MGVTREGPSLTISHMIFYDMLGDPEFYNQVPTYYFLKDQGLAIHNKIKDAILGKDTDCTGCTSIKKSVWPAFEVFAQHAFKLAQDNPDALKPLGEYITEKKGYRPTPILMYYKYQGITHKLVI